MAIWRAINLLLTLKCDESTRLVSESFERKLTGVERWAVRLHAVSCGGCRRVKKQLIFLKQAGEQHAATSQPLPPDARKRIEQSILDSGNR